jgi:hypothetical protein
MSKQRKKNRRGKLPLPPQPAKGGMPRLAVAFLAAAIVLSLGFWWWTVKLADNSSASNSTAKAEAANPAADTSKTDFQTLKGRWQRLDGGYIVEIKSVAGSGAADTAYFNPKPIHVAKAEASRDGETLQVFIELRDVNYPGSTYTLTYDAAADQLKGVYYQAVEGQRFSVAFVRAK